MNEQLAFVTKKEILDAMNEGMRKMIMKYSKDTDLIFVTQQKSIYLNQDN